MNKSLFVYEVIFDVWDIFLNGHRESYEYCYADNEAEAKNKMYWKYGDNIDIKSIEVDHELTGSDYKFVW